MVLNDVTLSSGETGVVQQLQAVTLRGNSQITDLTISGITVASVVIHPNPAGISISAVIEAIDTSRTANGVGYILGEPENSSTLGITPREADYDSDEDYRNNL